jgi:hypothetical protein
MRYLTFADFRSQLWRKGGASSTAFLAQASGHFAMARPSRGEQPNFAR